MPILRSSLQLCPTSSKPAGFSLIEIMVALAIAIILLGVAVPSMSTWLRKNTLNTLSANLVSTLQQARSEAIKRNGRVLVCASNVAGTDCESATPTNWGAGGWLVCTDLNGDARCDASTAAIPNPIRRERAIEPSRAVITGPSNPIRFNATGSQGEVGGDSATITATGNWSGATPLSITVAASGIIKGSRVP